MSPLPSPTTAIRTGTTTDLEALAMVLYAAFLYGDLGPYLVPQLAERARVYWPYFLLVAEDALRAGHVDLMASGATATAAAAIWYKVDDQFHPDPPDDDEWLEEAVGAALPNFRVLREAMRRHHPTGSPHHYLALLAVQPPHQGKGLGGRLLQHHHEQLDADAVPAYLEATGSRNQQLYVRHGYLPGMPYRVGPDGPPLYPMWREPQRRRRRRTRTGHAALRAV